MNNPKGERSTMNDTEFIQHFEAMKLPEQQKCIWRLAKLFNKNFQEAMQKVMHE